MAFLFFLSHLSSVLKSCMHHGEHLITVDILLQLAFLNGVKLTLRHSETFCVHTVAV